MKKTGAYQEGAQNRQKILDYLHENPGALAPHIYAHFGFNKNTGGARLKAMCYMKELRRKPEPYEYIDQNGLTVSVQTFAYFALVRETLNYDPDYKPGEKRGEAPPWVTRSCDVRNPYIDPPIPYQGGQGAARPRCISSMEYV